MEGMKAHIRKGCTASTALVIGLLATSSPASEADSKGSTVSKSGFALKKTDESVALLNEDKVVWQYNHKKAEGKPYFHPLGTVNGEVLTWLRPGDHVWHRAMWHSWKFINGLNYWEENRKTLKSQGTTEIVDASVQTSTDHTATIELNLSYHPPGKPEVLSEKRKITVSAPDANGAYRVDWEGTYTATADNVTLERTPIPGEPRGRGFGGYAGFSIRMAKETRGWSFVNSEGQKGKAVHGKNARWLQAYGNTPEGNQAALVILDHSSNTRHPSPWYLAENMPYFSPAVLFKEGMKLKKGESFVLKYRVLVSNGQMDKESLDAKWLDFCQ